MLGRQFRRCVRPMMPLACALLAACVSLGSLAAHAAPKSLMIVDANTGAVLIDQDGSEPRSPASLTKMMTLYMAFEALERGSATLRTPVRISARAANAAPSKLDLDVGDTIALEDAIKALITKSANDVAIAIAEHFAGTEDAFARSMTAKARELGMSATTFKNASGLPDSGQMTTARDMVTLSLRLYDTFPRHFGLFRTRSFGYGGKTYKNHNTLMISLPGVNGIKTGYTSASGFNLVTSYEAEGRHLIGAIFGGDSAAARNVAMRVALTRSLSKASTSRTRRPLIVASSRVKPPVSEPAPQPAVRVARSTAAEEAPDPVARPMATAAAAPAEARVADAALPRSAAASSTPSATVAPVLGPAVQIAKVRPVDVAPLTAQSTSTGPGVVPRSEGRQVAAASPTFELPPLAAGYAASIIRPVPPPQPVAPAAPTETRLADVAQTTGADVAATRSLPPAPALARRPSSLNQQHASLTASQPQLAAEPQPAAAWRLKGPVGSAAGAPPASPIATARSGGFDVQIGAVNSPEEADRLLATARARGGNALAGRAPVRVQVLVNGKTLHRARFTGFDQLGAAQACAELARQQLSCVVMRTE